MMIPFGILSAAGVSGEVPSDYELISTTILGTATSSVTFSSLGDYSSTYKHLQIRSVARSTRAGETNSRIRLQFNGITAANYFWHDLRGDGSAVTSGSQLLTSSMGMGRITAASSTANAFAATVIDALDCFSTSKNKTFRSLSGMTSENFIRLQSGSLAETDSITEITLLDEFGSFVAGSRFSLYGIKG
jgi:hypothetical protein